MDGRIAPKRLRRSALAVGAGFLVAVSAAPVEAGPVQSPTVELGSAARLAPDGRSVAIDLLAKCPERWTVEEAFVTVTQPQASGQASFSLTCTGSFQSFTSHT